tara:strand:- start:331 stop:1191 length:861 start_codon:yes stop_codon:yes gene_type:complete
MAKHSKVKNTGILFELLARQITTDTLNNVNSPAAIAIIKEYFGKGTTLRKELYLYQTLLKEKYSNEKTASKFLDYVLTERARINSSKLRREKYNLIREIKKNYDISQFFKAKISNYTQNAAVYTLFETSNPSVFVSPKSKLNSREIVVEYIIGKDKTASKVDRVVEAFRTEDKDLRLLAYKVLVDKFNKKYSKLNESQASVLREYINNISNTERLRTMLQEIVKKHLKVLSVELKKVDDKVVKIKLKEVARQLKTSLTNKSKIDEKKILNVLRLSELVNEVRNARK